MHKARDLFIFVGYRLKMYHEWMKKGLQLRITQWAVVKATPTTAVIDGGNGMGMVVGFHAMKIAIKKTRQ